jgi:hypothetical protein
MASIDFPDSPSVNDLFTVGDRTWIFTGDEVWQTVTSSTGAQGDKGGLRYAFDSVVTVAEPDAGFLRFNSATAASVTSIAISSQNRDSVDVSNFLVELGTSLPDELSVIKYYLVINGNANGSATNFIFAVDTIEDNGTWLELSGEYLAGVIPEDTEDLIISLSRVGDLGPTGPETSIEIGDVLTSLPGEDAEVGVTGPPGNQILSFTLPQGPTGPPTSISVESETGLPGGEADASITGPPGDQILSLTIPQGPTGPGGVYQYNVTGPTAPTTINGETVANGDTWFNSETGRFYIYYDGYWVENTSSLVGATGLGYDGITSASENSIPTEVGTKTFLLNKVGALAEGSLVTFFASSDVTKWIQGQLTSINLSTRSVVLTVNAWNGSGTFSSWNVSLSGRVGPTGPDGADGATGDTGPAGDPTLTVQTAKTGNYTVAAVDISQLIQMNSTGALTLFIPTDTTFDFPIGTQINVVQINTGQVTIAAVTPGTTTVNATPGLKLRAQWSGATLVKRAANTWWVTGDLTL